MMQVLKKNRQTILMVISLLLIVLFFTPWVKNNPNLTAVKYEEMKKSGFDIFRGYQAIVGKLDSLLAAMGHGGLGKLLYIGYFLILLPILGIASLVMSGLRVKGASVMHAVHYGFTCVPMALIFLLVVLISDVRELSFSIFGFGFGYYLSMILSIAGIVLLVATRKKVVK